MDTYFISGSRTLDSRLWTLDACLWTCVQPVSGLWSCGLGTLDSGFWDILPISSDGRLHADFCSSVALVELWCTAKHTAKFHVCHYSCPDTSRRGGGGWICRFHLREFLSYLQNGGQIRGFTIG